MITLHFHLQPQYKSELFHIYFTWFHCMGRYELNNVTLLPMCGFIAQLVEHRTGIAEVMGSNPVEALIFFRLLLSNCLNWKIYCDDHTSLSVTHFGGHQSLCLLNCLRSKKTLKQGKVFEFWKLTVELRVLETLKRSCKKSWNLKSSKEHKPCYPNLMACVWFHVVFSV